MQVALLARRLLQRWQAAVAALLAVAVLVLLFSARRRSADLLHAAKIQLAEAAAQAALDDDDGAGYLPRLPNTRVVVGISSFPGRIDFVHETVASLLRQSLMPDAIYISVPKRIDRLAGVVDFSQADSVISSLQARFAPYLHILRPEEDFGPATKLLGVLGAETDPDTLIVTLDDDTTYHEDTLLALVATAQHYADGQVCFECETVYTWLPSYRYLHGSHSEGVCHGFCSAYAGALYRRGFIDDSIFSLLTKEAPKGCRLHDDVFLAGFLYRKGIRPYHIVPGFRPVLHHRPYNKLSIHVVENGESEYRDPCRRFFDDFL